MNGKLIGFIFCSGIAAGVNFGSRIIFSVFVDFSTAVFLAFWCGLITAFLLNKFFIFTTSSLTTRRQFAGFILVNGIALLQTLLVSYLLGEWLLFGIPYGYEVAHAAGIITPIFTSYWGHQRISFQVQSS